MDLIDPLEGVRREENDRGVISLVLLIIIFIVGFLLTNVFSSTNRWQSIGIREVTSYNAVRAQCDDTPDIGAIQRVAVKGVPTGRWAACNFLPLHTKLKIPAVTGPVVWEVVDRTSKKYGHRIDLLLPIGETIGLRKVEVLIKEVKK